MSGNVENIRKGGCRPHAGPHLTSRDLYRTLRGACWALSGMVSCNQLLPASCLVVAGSPFPDSPSLCSSLYTLPPPPGSLSLRTFVHLYLPAVSGDRRKKGLEKTLGGFQLCLEPALGASCPEFSKERRKWRFLEWARKGLQGAASESII